MTWKNLELILRVWRFWGEEKEEEEEKAEEEEDEKEEESNDDDWEDRKELDHKVSGALKIFILMCK